MDTESIAELRSVHEQHPYYGVRRLALHLAWSVNKTRRIRTLAGVRIPRASKKYKYKRGVQPEIAAPINALRPYAVFKDSSRPQDGMDYSNMVNAEAWVQDFTHLWFEGAWCYLAVVMNLKTREIVGWRIGTSHSSDLTYAALLDALSKHPPPAILHSDQGSEYLSHRHQLLCDRMEMQLSVSSKGSPWQNGFMERWFGNFKQELPSLQDIRGIARLHEVIALQIHYYNTKRIHTALKMSPAAYAARLKTGAESSDRVLQKEGA